MNMPLAHHKPAPFRDHPPIVGGVVLRAECTRVVDGDTFDLLLEGQPDHVLVTERVRLHGVDTPEIFGAKAVPAGHVAKARVEELLPGRPLRALLTGGRDKYGRLVVAVEYQTPAGWADLADTLLTEGLAVRA